MMTQVWGHVGLEPGLRPPRVASRHSDAGFVEAAGQWSRLDDEFDLEARQQDLVEHPDNQFVLTDG